MATLARLVVSLTTDTAAFDRGMSGATRTIGVFSRGTIDMTRGLGMVERGLQNLTLRAAGIEGPLGKVFEGMSSIAGLSGPIALVGGAIAGIAIAWDKVGSALDRAQSAHATFLQSIRTDWIPSARGPVATGPAGGTMTPMVRRPSTEPLEATGWFAALLENVQQGTTLDAMLHGVPSGISSRDWLRLGIPAAAAGLLAGGLDRSRIPSGIPARLQFNASDAARFSRIAWSLPYRRGSDRGISGTDFALAGLSSLQGAIGGGGVGAAVQGGLSLGGLAIGAQFGAAGGPIGSAIGATVGLLLTTLFSKQKPLPVHDEQLTQTLRGVTLSPQQVTINVLGTADIEGALRAARRDSIDRVPAGSLPWNQAV